MSDDATTPEAAEEAVGEEEAPPKKKGLSGKKLVLFIVLPILLLAGGGAGAYFAGLFGGSEPVPVGENGQELQPLEAATFYNLPDLLVNLRTGQSGQSFLRLSVSLEVSSKDGVSLIEQVEPRIVDSFQVYLRELRVEDLSGSAGLQRLREELLLRVNAAAQSHVVKDVLFKEMLIQ